MMPGTSAARAHCPQVMLMPAPVASEISLTTSGFGAVAVMNIAELMGLVL
jgi:hypothetical protein